MRNDFNKIKGGNPLNNLLVGQSMQPAPLLQVERLVLFEDYIVKGFGMMRAVMEADDRFIDHMPALDKRAPAIEVGEILNVAAFSLSQYFGSSEKALSNMEDILFTAAEINEHFNADDTGIHGSCVIVSIPLQQTGSEMPDVDVMMLFYPGTISAQSWDKKPLPQVNDAKFKFFALLQDRGLINERDITMNGIDIGLQGRKLSQEAEKLQASAAVKTAPKNTL